jgi:hypothetical protein
VEFEVHFPEGIQTFPTEGTVPVIVSKDSG